MPLKSIAPTLRARTHGPIPPHRFWGYYSWLELAELAKDPNATAVLNVGAIAQCGPHLPVATNTMSGLEVLGPALDRLPPDVVVLGLPPTYLGKSIEHDAFPGTITLSGDTLRLVLLDIAASVARTGFSKLVILGSHGGTVGLIDDFFRDLHMHSGLRVFKIHISSVGNIPGIVPQAEAGVSLHGGDGGTSMILAVAPELVDMSLAAGYVYEPAAEIGFSFHGHDAIEAWATTDLSANGVIGNPTTATAERGQQIFEAKVSRLAQLLEAIYRDPTRTSHLAGM